jgi:hypothetical protein
VIGDVVGSKRLSRPRRTVVQTKLGKLLENLNSQLAGDILSKFVITVGDEFQVLLRSAETVPDVLWAIETHLSEVSIRLGIGFGVLHTPLREFAIGMDGPAFHEARKAINIAKNKGWQGGVFMGFGEAEDTMLNGLARLLERQRNGMTEPQREVANRLRTGMKQIDVAKDLGTSRQAVNHHVRAMGWKTYEQGEAAWRVALRRFGATR